MFSRFGFASFYSPLTLLLRFLPFFYCLLRLLSYYSVYHFLLSPSTPVLSLHWLRNVFFFYPKLRQDKRKKKKNESSLVSVRCERLELSGWVWGGCDAVRNHRRCGWRCRPLRPDWCTVSAFPPREPPTATLSGCVSPLTPFPPFFNVHTRIYSKHVRTHAARSSLLLLRRPALSCHLFIRSLWALSDTWITRVEHAIRAWVEVLLSHPRVDVWRRTSEAVLWSWRFEKNIRGQTERTKVTQMSR